MRRRAIALAASVALAGLLLSARINGQSGGIIVDGADDTLTLGVTNPAALPGDLGSRFVLWYANELLYQEITPVSPALFNELAQVDDRFIVWYGNQLRYVDITPVPPQALTLLANVSERFRVWYANQMKYVSLNPISSDMLQTLGEADDRIALWYANENRYHHLVYPLGLIQDTTAPLISDVSATATSATSWRISWTTDEFADSEVVYGLNPGGYTESAQDPLYVTDHLVQLSSLVVGATYYYRARSTDLSGNGSQSPEMSFVVSLPDPPTVTGIAPASGVNDSTTHITDLSGSGYHAGATVRLQQSGESDIVATSVTILDASQITCDFDLNGAAAGAWDVVVTNVDGQSGSLDDGFTVLTTLVPNDPMYSQQWSLAQIDLLGAWPYSRGTADTVIAVIDTGVEYSHIDLAGSKMLTAIDYDYVNGDGDAYDDEGHGTHVAGIAAAVTDNDYGIAGVCPDCRILPIKVLDAAGHGTSTNLATAIEYATDAGADVINLSLGGSACSADVADAINYAYDHGVVVVAAAGNACPVNVALGEETFDVNYPAKLGRVVAVGATSSADNRAYFSCYGPEVDVAAPGVGILSTYPYGGYKKLDGTSMASPMVAGLSGLLLSQDPSLTPAQVQRILEVSADDVAGVGWDEGTGWGRINARTALQTTVGTVTPVPPVTCPTVTSDPVNATGTREESLVSLYSQVRDEVLLASPVGQRYVSYYGHYGPELAGILITSADLRSRTAQFLDHASEEFESLLPNSTTVITFSQELYDEGNALVQDLTAAGSEELGDAMLQVWQDLALVGQIGDEPIQIWEEMQISPVYLPLIVR